MAAVVKIDVNIAASGGGKQVIDDLNNIDGAARKASGGFGFLGQAAATALGGVVAGAATAAAGAIAGFVGGSISAAGTFEASVNNLAAVTGSALADAGFSFDDVSAKALQLGQDTAYSAQESITAMTELVKGGVPVEQVMSEATDATLALAAASGTDLAAAAEIMAKQYGVWSDTGVEATQVADLLTQAANASTVGVEDLALGLANAGGTAKTAGVEFQDLVQGMALIAPNFSSASDAGTSFKTFLSRLIPTTEPAKAAMQELGLYTAETGSKFYDAQGNFIGMEAASELLQTATAGLSEEQRLLAFNTIFGSDAIRAAAAIAEAGGEGFAQMGTDMAAAGGAMETAAVQNQGFNFALDSLKGTLETVQIQLGTYLLPYLTAFIETTTNVINAVMGNTAAFAALSPALQQVVTFVQGLVPVAMELGSILAANWQPILAAVAGVIAALVVPALASFVVAVAPVVAAVMGAIAIGAALYNAWNSNFMGIQTSTQGALAIVQSTVQQVMSIVLAFWQENGAEIMAFAQETWATIQEIISTVVAIVAEIVKQVFGGIMQFIGQHGDEIVALLTYAWDQIQSIIDLALNTIQGVTTTILGALRGDWDTAANGIKQIVQGLADFVLDQFDNILKLIENLGGRAAAAGRAFIQSLRDGIMGKIESLINDAKTALQGLADLLPGSEPKDPTSPLRGLAARGAAIIGNLQTGIDASALSIAPAVMPAMAQVSAMGGDRRTYSSNRVVNYNATFNGVGASGVSDAIARSLAGV